MRRQCGRIPTGILAGQTENQLNNLGSDTREPGCTPRAEPTGCSSLEVTMIAGLRRRPCSSIFELTGSEESNSVRMSGQNLSASSRLPAPNSIAAKFLVPECGSGINARLDALLCPK